MSENMIRVLFVDDDEDDYVIIREYLSRVESARYDLEWVNDYATALRYIKECRHDVYLFDYRLGIHNGLELLQEVVSFGNKVPVILLTGQNDYEIDLKAMECGAYDYLVKNEISPSILERSIRYAVQRKRLYEMEEESKVKSEFIANMSHELRTPLNVILGALQLSDVYLNNDLATNKDKLSKHMKSMKQNCLRLLRLVNNLIDTTKIDAGYFDMQLCNYNIIQIVQQITLSVSEYVAQKRMRLVFETDTDERMIACDADMVERIMLNLLSNAIKFTCPGGTIHVSIRNEAESVLISVKDNGVGIPKDKLEIIFERYKQVGKLLTRDHEGSGIGLSLTKSLVEMHGGKISVRSEMGSGSEFIVEFPVREYHSEMVKEEGVSYFQNKQVLIERMNVEFSDIYK